MDQTREDGLEPIYKDLEQEVKDAEPEKVQKTATKKAAVTEAATAALTAAADGDAIKKNNAGSSRSNRSIRSTRNKRQRQEIVALIQERKMTEKHEKKERIREISKKIKKKCIREKERTTRQEKIQKILEEPKGTKNISNIKSAKKRIFIPKIKNKKGETINTRKGIAKVFAEFYENLYKDEEGEEDKKREKKSRTEDKKKCLINSTPSQNLQKARSKMLSTASRKEKQKTAVEYKLNSSKIAVT